ncbi:MAG: ribonuclease P protein component [Planctomycetaceae bacterium]
MRLTSDDDRAARRRATGGCRRRNSASRPTAATGGARARLRFRRPQRVRSSLDFKRIYDLKQRAGDEHLLLFAAPNGLAWSRIGVSVSRRQGNSIARHRLRRLLKEAFRLSQHDLPPGLDIILVPRVSSGATVNDYQQSLVRLTSKLARRRALQPVPVSPALARPAE